LEKNKVIDTLNSILETELSGVVRYTDYSFMIFGHARIPIIGLAEVDKMLRRPGPLEPSRS
jgi:bacterioferritin (cytochrome b1)